MTTMNPNVRRGWTHRHPVVATALAVLFIAAVAAACQRFESANGNTGPLITSPSQVGVNGPHSK